MIRIFSIETPWSGQLATMARPSGGENLAGEMRELRAAGVDHLVCLMEMDELIEVELETEAAAADAAGIQFLHLPVADRQLPDDVARMVREAQRLCGALQGGASIVTHCRGGIGRATLMAAGILMAGGIDGDDALDRISYARGLRVPDTTAQRQWIIENAATFRAPKRP